MVERPLVLAQDSMVNENNTPFKPTRSWTCILSPSLPSALSLSLTGETEGENEMSIV